MIDEIIPDGIIKRRPRIRKMDWSLDSVLLDLQKQMNEAMMGGITYMQAQRELAFRIRRIGLHNFENKKEQQKDDKKRFRF